MFWGCTVRQPCAVSDNSMLLHEVQETDWNFRVTVWMHVIGCDRLIDYYTSLYDLPHITHQSQYRPTCM
jgi:hypothetical protein